MCGIAVALDHGRRPDPETVRAMADAMSHRGPDGSGFYADDDVALGVRRLAVIDVAGGDQPIANEDGTVLVALNGEIYNFRELRRELEARGHRFRTRSDTEVIVHLYEEHGDDLVHRLRGMFAFAVWDRSRRRLLCARDRVGKKPLFWHQDGGRITMASELRALLTDRRIARTLDIRALDAYLLLGYVPDPMCAVAGVRKLPPGGRLVVDGEGARVDSWWHLEYAPDLPPDDPREARERVWSLIEDATRARLGSDVPLGAFLSGGIDSTSVVAAMAANSSRVKTFSISFDEPEFDEADYARRVADHYGTEHHEFHVRPDALALMPELARAYGEPYADGSAIPTFLLAKHARAHVTVALTGDGGDESFGGYDRYVRAGLVAQLGWVPEAPRAGLAAIGSAVGRGDRTGWRARAATLTRVFAMDTVGTYTTTLGVFNRPARERLLSPALRAELDRWSAEEVIRNAWRSTTAAGDIDRMLGTDVATYLPGDLLVKVDIATMAHSLEARCPLVDHELMSYAARLPAALKVRRFRSKVLMRQALRGRVPDEVLTRPKRGFGAPLRDWFRGMQSDLPGELLLDPAAHTAELFDRREVERLITEHRSGAADRSRRLWSLLMLETWFSEVAKC